MVTSGFPPYHPLVTAQHPGDEAAAGLSEELKKLVAAGYNTKELFFGPEGVRVACLHTSRLHKRFLAD